MDNKTPFDNIKIEDLLSVEQLAEHNKRMAVCNNNINGFGLPIKISQDKEYYKCLEDVLKSYASYISEKEAFNTDSELINGVNDVNLSILKAIDEYLNGDIKSAQQAIYDILQPFCNDSFIVSTLNENYAFRGIAPFKKLHTSGHNYDLLLNYELSFFRARKSSTIISDSNELSYIPLDRRELVGTGRFSISGVPCLYLGTTSYCCWLELDRPARNEFHCSSLKVTEVGKKLRILNLVISEGLINGIFNRPIDKEYSLEHELQRKMMIIFPLVIATSFRIAQSERKFKSEYIISQLIMQSLKSLNIDGIAYLSKQSYSDFEYPHSVNLAIPVSTTNKAIIDNSFSITKPISLELFTMLKNEENNLDHKSFINKNFSSGFTGQINPSISVPYDSTYFSSFDDFLVNLK